MNLLNLFQPKSSIIGIIFMLWLLICLGTPVVVSIDYIAAGYYVFVEKCDPLECISKCNGDSSLPRVGKGQLVPFMLHLCVGEKDCYCSIQNSDAYAWARERAIIGYDCQVSLPREEGTTYEYQKCLIDCLGLGFIQKTINQNDETIADVELIFNIVINYDCCCGGMPVFSMDLEELSNVHLDKYLDNYLNPPDELSPKDHQSSSTDSEIQGKAVAVEDDDVEVVHDDDTVDEDAELNEALERSSQKRPYDWGVVDYAEWDKKHGKDFDPIRESSNNAANKRMRLTPTEAAAEEDLEDDDTP